MRCGRDHRDRSLEGRRDRSPVESRKRRFEEDDKIERDRSPVESRKRRFGEDDKIERDRSPVESRKRRFEEDDKIETGYERRRSSGGCDNNHRYESGEEGEEVNDAKGGDYNESGKRGGGRFDQPPPDRLE